MSQHFLILALHLIQMHKAPCGVDARLKEPPKSTMAPSVFFLFFFCGQGTKPLLSACSSCAVAFADHTFYPDPQALCYCYAQWRHQTIPKSCGFSKGTLCLWMGWRTMTHSWYPMKWMLKRSASPHSLIDWDCSCFRTLTCLHIIGKHVCMQCKVHCLIYFKVLPLSNVLCSVLTQLDGLTLTVTSHMRGKIW